MTKDGKKNVSQIKSTAKQQDLRETIRKYLETQNESVSFPNIGKVKKEIEKNVKNESMKSEDKRRIDTINESTSLKIASTNERVDDENLILCNDKKELTSNFFARCGEKNQQPKGSSGQLQKRGNLLIRGTAGTPFKIPDLDVFPQGTDEEIGEEIATKLDEPRVDMVIAVVGVIGIEAAIRIFQKTRDVELGGGMMVKNGDRRRTAGGTFFQLVRETRDPNIDQDKVNSVFDKLNDVEKTDAKTDGNKRNAKLDRPCDYFNDFGICKFKTDHFSQSGFTRRIHMCRFCFYRHEVENYHPEKDCRLYQAFLLDSNAPQSLMKGSDMILKTESIRTEKPAIIDKILTGSNAFLIGSRSGLRAEKESYEGTAQQENIVWNISNALGSRVDLKSYDGRKFGDALSSKNLDGFPRSRKRVEFQDRASEEKETNKANQKLPILPKHDKLKPILKESEHFQVRQNKESKGEANGIIVKSIENSTENDDELAVKTNMEWKFKGKKEQKDRFSDKSLEKKPEKAEQNEKLKTKVEQKKIANEQTKRKTMDKNKQGPNNNKIQQKLHDEGKPKENVQNKKYPVKQESNNVKKEQTEKNYSKICSKEKVGENIQEKPNLKASPYCKVSENGIFCEKNNGKGKLASKYEQKKKPSDHIEKESKQDCKVDESKQDCKVDFKNVDKSKHQKKLSSLNSSATSSSSKVLGIQSPNVTPGKGYRKERLHCPCPPYCPTCLNILKIK